MKEFSGILEIENADHGQITSDDGDFTAQYYTQNNFLGIVLAQPGIRNSRSNSKKMAMR